MNIRSAMALAKTLEGSDSPRLDIELLLSYVLQQNRTYLMTYPEQALTAAQQTAFLSLLQRRQLGEPVAYLLGEQGFWSLMLQVSPATLIPRPETELLVELALSLLLPESLRALDLGTGTGAIALALASERCDWQVIATDVQVEAVELAERNRASLSLNNVEVRQSRWFDRIPESNFHLIVSNPPYIDDQDPHLSEGDVRFEPRSALVAHDGGLADLSEIVTQAPAHLADGGWLLLEHGYDQGEAVRQLLAQSDFTEIKTHQDLNGCDRVTLGCWWGAALC
ncbi:peptide chain release factor N(5)-glutamine methyltransferase [Marinibactrum halimedae]|nr:peptide chain release factor N(5)-glutamine methyltransferase [Marinibactrum halimedae]MCD9457454.1 peptide chain release factor N(5)-glutamine methyltransferase [Marinibactrum halimedae]